MPAASTPELLSFPAAEHPGPGEEGRAVGARGCASPWLPGQDGTGPRRGCDRVGRCSHARAPRGLAPRHRAPPRLRTAVRPPGGERHRHPRSRHLRSGGCSRGLRVLLDRRSLHWAALGCVGLCLRLCSRPGAVNVSGNWRAAAAFARRSWIRLAFRVILTELVKKCP